MIRSAAALWLGACTAAVIVDPAADTDVRPAETDLPVETDLPGPLPPYNVVIVFIDDVGRDAIAPYTAPPEAAEAPTLTALAEAGVRFDRAWATPVCSPSRAALLTGRLPWTTGIGRGIAPADTSPGLPEAEVTLAEHFKAAGYATAAVGKWHLASLANPEPERHPNTQGFDTFLGTPANLTTGDAGPLDESRGYTSWYALEDGEITLRRGWITETTFTDATRLATTMPEPWFLYVAPHAAHAPFEALPGEDPRAPEWIRHRRLLTDVDTRLGALLDALDPEVRARTIVVVAGDNGTPPPVTRPPFDADRGKFSLFDSGVGVPLVIAGPGIAAGPTRAFAHVADLAPTLLALNGLAPAPGSPPMDGVDLGEVLRAPSAAGPRTHLLTGQFDPNGLGVDRVVDVVAVRDDGWSLHVDRLTGEERLWPFGPDGREAGAMADPAAPGAAEARERLREILGRSSL